MQLFVDNTGRQFITSASAVVTLNPVVVAEDDIDQVTIWLLDRPSTAGQALIPAAIPAPFTQMVLAGKANLSDTDCLFSCTSWAQQGSGSTLCYVGTLSLDTSALQSALAGRQNLQVYLEIDLLNDDATARRCLTPGARGLAIAAVYNGTEGVPTSGDPAYPVPSAIALLASPTFTGVPAAPTAAAGTNTTQLASTAFVNAEIAAASGAVLGQITALTGDTGSTLDGIATVALGINTVYGMVIGGQLKWYQLQAGGSGVHPADYNASTNNVSWVEVA